MFLMKAKAEQHALDNFLEKVLAGEFASDYMPNEVLPNAISFPGLSDQIMAADNDNDRVIQIERHFISADFFEALEQLDKHFLKSVQAAQRLLQKAKEKEKSKDLETALRCYNLALCYVPPDNLDLMNAIYFDRSSVLFRLEELNGCITDIEASIRLTGNSVNVSRELQELKDLCAQQEQRENNANNRRQTNRMKEYMDNVIFNVKGGKNSKIPSAGTCVRILSDKNKGRYLVATANLEPGTTIIVETPYAVVLDNCTRYDMRHCFRCFQATAAPIPCPSCVYATYCSEACLKKDHESGHEYECPCLPFMHAMKFETSMLLSVKAICATGPMILLEYFRSLQPVAVEIPQKPDNLKRKSNALLPGFDPKTGMYESESYHQIYNLSSHPINDKTELAKLTWSSFALTRIIHKKTNFFSNVKQPEKYEFRRFIASVILRHAVSFPYNNMAVKRTAINKDGSGEIVQEERMTAVYSLVSMLNHSCDPNAMWEQKRNGQIAIFTNRRIKTGDEITLSYGWAYQTYNFEERTIALSQNYFMKCNCVPCRYKWPMFTENIRPPYKILCPHCVRDKSYSRAFRTQFCYLDRTRKVGTCVICKQEFDFKLLSKQTTKHVKMLVEACRHENEGNSIEAVALLTTAIAYFQGNVAEPCQDQLIAQQMLRDCYTKIVGA